MSVVRVAPVVAMLMIASVSAAMTGTNSSIGLRIGRRASVGISGVQVQDRGPRARGFDRLLGDLNGRYGQIFRHGRRVDGSGYGAGDDDLAPARRRHGLPLHHLKDVRHARP